MIRELFVELSTGLFETIKGIGEQAVRAAQPQPKPTPRRLAFDNEWFLAAVVRRYGWSSAEHWRCEYDDVTELRVSRPCGHRIRYRLPDRIYDRDLIGVLDRIVAGQGNGCFCVERQS